MSFDHDVVAKLASDSPCQCLIQKEKLTSEFSNGDNNDNSRIIVHEILFTNHEALRSMPNTSLCFINAECACAT